MDYGRDKLGELMNCFTDISGDYDFRNIITDTGAFYPKGTIPIEDFFPDYTGNKWCVRINGNDCIGNLVNDIFLVTGTFKDIIVLFKKIQYKFSITIDIKPEPQAILIPEGVYEKEKEYQEKLYEYEQLKDKANDNVLDDILGANKLKLKILDNSGENQP